MGLSMYPSIGGPLQEVVTSCLSFVIFLANRCQESFPRAESGREKRAVARVERGAVPGKAKAGGKGEGFKGYGKGKSGPAAASARVEGRL